MLGVAVYGAVTVVSVASFYVVLRMGGDAILMTPLEKGLGGESDTFLKLKKRLGDAAINATSTNGDANDVGINWVREGTYLGIAGVIDSFVMPLKLAASLSVTRAILKRGGR